MASRPYWVNSPAVSRVLTPGANGPAPSYHRCGQLCFLAHLQHKQCTSTTVLWCFIGPTCCVQGLVQREEGNLGDVLLLFPTDNSTPPNCWTSRSSNPCTDVQIVSLTYWEIAGHFGVLRTALERGTGNPALHHAFENTAPMCSWSSSLLWSKRESTKQSQSNILSLSIIK